MVARTLHAASEELVAFAAECAVDGDDRRREFSYGAVRLREDDDAPAHRCLSASEARAKLSVVHQLTGRSLNQLLVEWDELPTATLQMLEKSILSLDAQERRQGIIDQPDDWCRFDELLFRLAFSAWIYGTNFAPASRPSVAAQQIGLPAHAYTQCLTRLRSELVRPTWDDCQPRVDLWLGDPPRGEADTKAPRLWVSARCHYRSAYEAGRFGLLPANTLDQGQTARATIYRRWFDQEDNTLDEPLPEVPPYRYTFCRRCGKMIEVAALLGVRRDI